MERPGLKLKIQKRCRSGFDLRDTEHVSPYMVTGLPTPSGNFLNS